MNHLKIVQKLQRFQEVIWIFILAHQRNKLEWKLS